MFAIIDLEWTSWKGSHERNWSFEWEKREIIQIGTIKFNNLKNIKTKSILVKPNINKNLSHYIQNLTGINQYTINFNSLTLEKSFLELCIFFTDVDKIFYNGLDKEIILENCKFNNLRKPIFLKKMINLGPKIREKLNSNKEHFTSSHINEKIGFKKLKTHRALNDCMNILNFIKKYEIC